MSLPKGFSFESTDGLVVEFTPTESLLIGTLVHMYEDTEMVPEVPMPFPHTSRSLKAVKAYAEIVIRDNLIGNPPDGNTDVAWYHKQQQTPDAKKLTSGGLRDVDKRFADALLDRTPDGAIPYDGVFFETILAANQIDFPLLLNVTTEYVADLLRGAKSPEDVRKTFGIKNDFTPAEEEEINKEYSWLSEK
jgi:hypothetical protein